MTQKGDTTQKAKDEEGLRFTSTIQKEDTFVCGSWPTVSSLSRIPGQLAGDQKIA